MSDSICCICLDPLSSPIMAMTPCGHCFHMSCIQQWADAAADRMDEDDEEDDEDPASRLCCPFCRKQSQHKMRLFLELPPPFALQDDDDDVDEEEEEEEQVPVEESDQDVVPQDERKMPATRSATAKEKATMDSPSSSSRSGRKRSHDQQDNNNNKKPSKMAKKNDDHFDLVKLTKENQVLKKKVRQLQNKLVLQSRKHLAHERQQVDEMENLMSVASETKKSLVTEQRRVRKCMMALEKFRDVDNGLQALVSRAFSEKEEAACNLAKLAEMHEAICSKLQLRKPPPRVAKGTSVAAAAAAAAASSSNTSGTVKEKKVLTHWFKRYELESIQKTLEEIHQLFDGDSDDEDDDDDEDDHKPNANTAQRRITRSLSRQQEQQT